MISIKQVLIVVVLVLGFLGWWYKEHPLQTTATIRGHKIILELAVTPKEKQKGLGFRDSLPPDHGMLFLMNEPAYHGFWMKDMKFPLDFIWINDKTVVDLTENVPSPIGYEPPASLKPKSAADKVLEVNAGVIRRIGIQIGDTVEFNR